MYCISITFLFVFQFQSRLYYLLYFFLPFSSNSNITWLHPVDGMFHLIFATAPVLWLLGILPPIDAYILWFLEQWHVLVLGKLIQFLAVGRETCFSEEAIGKPHQ